MPNFSRLTHHTPWLIGGILLATACSSSVARMSDGSSAGGDELVSDASATGPKRGADAAADATVDPADASDAADASDDAADASDASTCLGDEPGPPPACPTEGPCAELCADVVAHYRAGVGRAAAACIASACTGALDVVPCVDRATARACPVEDALPYCQAMVMRCDPDADDPEKASGISTPGCVAIATALAPAGRTTFQTCLENGIEAGTCPTDVVACADSIRQ